MWEPQNWFCFLLMLNFRCQAVISKDDKGPDLAEKYILETIIFPVIWAWQKSEVASPSDSGHRLTPSVSY